MSRRAGFTLVETLVALLVGMLVVGLSLELLVRARSAQRSLSERAEALATLRIVRHVLRTELRVAAPGRDFSPPSDDSLAMRVFRGVGAVCPDRPSADEVLVSYAGLRAPDAEKDSVLFLTTEGAWWPVRLEASGPTSLACGAAAEVPVQRWRLSEEPPAGVVLARIFERGSYHLSGGAVRYRRGAGGRQPLTPEVVDERLSRFVHGASLLALELVPAAGPPVAWRGFLRAFP